MHELTVLPAQGKNQGKARTQTCHFLSSLPIAAVLPGTPLLRHHVCQPFFWVKNSELQLTYKHISQILR